jgi:prevent-host-death family protein
MIREASAMKVRQNLGELINEVQYRHDTVLVTKAGKRVAAIVDVELFEKIRLLEAEFNRLVAQLQKAYQGRSLEAVEAELQKARTASRRRTRR